MVIGLEHLAHLLGSLGSAMVVSGSGLDEKEKVK